MSDPKNDQQQPPANSSKKVKARVLTNTTINGKPRAPNDVVSVDEKTLKAHAAELDAHPEAVKYAEGLKRGEEAED